MSASGYASDQWIATRPLRSLSINIRIAIASVMIAVFCSSAMAQRSNDPPWSAERIDRLPPEIRNQVLAICPRKPEAGHYFATYFGDRITLH
jgi:hypothetical protein